MAKNYIYPEKAKAINNFLKDNFKKGAYDHISDENLFANQLITDINHVHYDGHFRIQFIHDLKNLVQIKETPEEKKQKQEAELTFLKNNNFMFTKVEILPGNIGYFAFNEFSSLVDSAKPTLNAALIFLSNTKALIIDLRNNGGGNAKMVNQFQNYFLPHQTLVTNTFTRTDKDPVQTITDSTQTNHIKLNMPVYILTSSFTASGAEMFAYNLQSLNRAKIIGNKTRGVVNLSTSFYLGNGFIINVPFAHSINPYTHQDIENIGVKPNIEANGGDALNKALESIYLDDLKNTTEPKQKRVVQWALNDLKVKTDSIKLDLSKLNEYEGKYVGFTFFIKDNELYCINNDLGGIQFRLKPVNQNTFTVDEKLQVEFNRNNNGKVVSLNMLFKDGNIFIREKI